MTLQAGNFAPGVQPKPILAAAVCMVRHDVFPWHQARCVRQPDCDESGVGFAAPLAESQQAIS